MRVNVMDTNERELIERICKGELEAFRQMVEKYKKKIYYLAYDIIDDHHEAEDISQEVFIKVYRNISKFRKEAKFSSWIYQITVNASIDAKRKQSLRTHLSIEDNQIKNTYERSALSDNKTKDPEIHTEITHTQDQIHRTLDRISPKERSIFIMRYFNGFKLGEISDVLNISTNTIKSFLHRARKKIRKELSLSPGNHN
jgi:RNA polymerase sigma-70 factor (ECF subfamily)